MSDKTPRAEALYKWVEANVPEAEWKASGKTVQEACLWLCAVNLASEYHDYTTKEFAEMLQGGMSPLDESDLEDWIEGYAEPEEDDLLPAGFLPVVRDFWS